MKITLPSYLTQKSELSNSEILYLIKFSRYVARLFYFYFFHSKAPELQKMSYDVTI